MGIDSPRNIIYKDGVLKTTRDGYGYMVVMNKEVIANEFWINTDDKNTFSIHVDCSSFIGMCSK